MAVSGPVREIHVSSSGPFLVPQEPRFLVLHEYPSPQIEQLWYKFLDHIDSPSHYDAPEYFLEPYWAGKRPFVVLALYENQVVGVLSGLHSEAATGCGVLSRPQVRTDEKLDSLFPSDLLAEGLLLEAGRDKLITVYAWNWVPLEGFEQRGFLRRELEGNVVLDLHLGPDAIYKGFHENRKRNIRAALKNGIEISEAATLEDLMAYWEVYSRWQQTKRKNIAHNLSFATIEKVHHLRHNHRRFLARFRGKVIAATGLRFRPGGLVEYANNCSLDEFMYLRPNDLLIWQTIEWACQQGFTKYSLGGAHSFLRKSGKHRAHLSLSTRPDLSSSSRLKGKHPHASPLSPVSRSGIRGPANPKTAGKDIAPEFPLTALRFQRLRCCPVSSMFFSC